MITLKLAVYTEKEVELLRNLLFNNRHAVQHEPFNGCGDCATCDYRHLCIDLAQAHIYAKDYTAKR